MDGLPRASNLREGLAIGKEAMVYVNDMGDLAILIDEVGLLTVPEDDLDAVRVEVD